MENLTPPSAQLLSPQQNVERQNVKRQNVERQNVE
jgi:hypothetical protein